jgi:ribosomal protein S18 acetylase RimI-like enzyme
MNIRRATRSDLQSIAAIHIESWKDAYSGILPAEFLAVRVDHDLAKHWSEIEIHNEDIVLVAEEDALVGFIAVWCRPNPFIDNLHVKPSHRCNKIGSALMKAAAKELIRKGYKTCYLWVFESNEKALRFYERFGGMQKEQAMKTVFGYEVLNRKIEWDNLSLICNNP